MCQINTDPMKSQVGYLDVVVPPDILDYPTSTDLVVQEGSNVTLQCVAKGSPKPSILWRREDNEPIIYEDDQSMTAEGPTLNISKVSRHQMGPYLCIASNGIPPSVSKRIMLIVNFPPIIWIQYQLVGAYDSQHITLECHSEAYPKSINYWTRDKGEIVPQSEKYEPILVHSKYKVHMKLLIRDIGPADYGIYKCISKNSIGETDGTINVYRIPKPFTNKTTHMKTKSLSSNLNEVTYQVSHKDRADTLIYGASSNLRAPFWLPWIITSVLMNRFIPV